MYFDGISSLGNVVDKDGTCSEHIPKFTKLKSLLALARLNQTFSEHADSLPRLHSKSLLKTSRLRSTECSRKRGYLSDPKWVRGSLWHSGETFL